MPIIFVMQGKCLFQDISRPVSPNTVGVTSINYFNVVAIGNISKRVVKCVFFYFQLNFSPNTVGVTSIDYFNVVAFGNISKSVVKCVFL